MTHVINLFAAINIHFIWKIYIEPL